MNIKKRGFTLLELLVVIAIVGILAAIILSAIGGARSKSNDASVQEHMNSLRNAAEVYNTANSTYNLGAGYAPTQCATSSPDFFSDTDTAGYAITSGIFNVNGVISTNFICANNGATWVAIVNLPSNPSPNGFWCTDSTGATKPEPGETVGSGLVDNGVVYNGVDGYACQ